jgi:NAD(P)-dependent dehydrogenase (short-subunit alcohol dehydrogenase family)
MKLTREAFVARQKLPVPPLVRADFSGKTIIVTGANAGLGFEACKHFASMGVGKLIMACRSEARGQDAVKGQSSFNHTSLYLNLILV